MFTDDPVKDAMRRDREHQNWLDRLPHCAHCHQAIQEDKYFVIEGANVHRDCLEEYCENEYETYNTEL